MCGRFAYHSPISILKKRFNIEAVEAPNLGPDYNVAPSHPVYAVIKDRQRKLVVMKWGVVPPWAKAGKQKKISPLINARCETVHDKPTFKEAFQKRRCLILADGYYEWENTPSGKKPWYISMEEKNPLAFAGIYELTGKKSNHDDDISFIGRCTILTTSASQSFIHIHHRMPVVFSSDFMESWLDPENQNLRHLSALLTSCKKNGFKIIPVSKRVNSVKNNNPSLICPVPEEPSLF